MAETVEAVPAQMLDLVENVLLLKFCFLTTVARHFPGPPFIKSSIKQASAALSMNIKSR
jgi:hypothetical protein